MVWRTDAIHFKITLEKTVACSDDRRGIQTLTAYNAHVANEPEWDDIEQIESSDIQELLESQKDLRFNRNQLGGNINSAFHWRRGFNEYWKGDLELEKSE